MKRIFYFACILMLASLSAPLSAADDALKEAQASVKRLFPGESNYKVNKTPVPGLYEVEFSDSFIYITADGKYAVKGEIIDVDNNISITESKRSTHRLQAVNTIPEDEMLIYEPAEGKTRHTVTVFTDIDCSYCRVMHRQIDSYLSRGIRMRYVFQPRAGKNTSSYYKAVKVWCSDDRHKAMTEAKQGKELTAKECPNPVDKHMAVAAELGITGTPTIILEDGGRLPGYVPPDRLWLELERRKRIANQVR